MDDAKETAMNEHSEHSELSAIDSMSGRGKIGNIFSTIFGGSQVERRPIYIGLVILAIIFLGFIVGTLFTMGVLSGVIEINPKALKAVIYSLIGKS